MNWRLEGNYWLLLVLPQLTQQRAAPMGCHDAVCDNGTERSQMEQDNYRRNIGDQ